MFQGLCLGILLLIITLYHRGIPNKYIHSIINNEMLQNFCFNRNHFTVSSIGVDKKDHFCSVWGLIYNFVFKLITLGRLVFTLFVICNITYLLKIKSNYVYRSLIPTIGTL